MKKALTNWTKHELKIYLLCLCANVDNVESVEEIELIKSKTDAATFEKMYSEFKADKEEISFEKIEDTIERLSYENMELITLKKEINEIFYADDKFPQKERNLDNILNNMLY